MKRISRISKAKKKILQQGMEKLDKEIDALVYELYGLSKEEIEVIEGSL